ncbi:MAG: CoA protein activase [Clostridia bacterium]|nr:CoA protein activase [Clostridia bacterium]
MKLTFPHMGNTYVTVKALLDDLGVDYVIPPFNNKKALEVGTKLAPELACLPLKINLGNYVQAYEDGADTILMAGGCGPCRFGYYCEIQREILRDNGYEMDMITLEMPDQGIKELANRIKKLSGRLNIPVLLKAIKNTAQVSRMVDELEKLSYKVRPREIRKGTTDKIYKTFLNNVKAIRGSKEIKGLIRETENELKNVEMERDCVPLKVGIVGEIYTTIDSYTSFNIDIKLGNMGIEVDRSVTVSEWVIDHIIKNALHLPRDMSYAEAAKPYLGTMIGGHAQETIGNTILYARNGYDGVIQIYPLTCMPEIVAESILPAIEKDYNIPVLTLIIDEMTGEAGYLTRVEAFIDLLEKRRERAAFEGNWLLSGN